MNFNRIALLGFLVLLTGLAGCGASSKQESSTSITVTPGSAVVGSPDLDLTIAGSNFRNARHNLSQAVWSVNGADTFLATNFVSSTQLTAIVPAALLANSTTAEVFVQTGDPMGDGPFLNSSSVRFPVTASAPGATQISSISPASAVAGSPDLALTIIGSNFDGTGIVQSRVVWVVNGSTLPLSTTFVSETLLTALIPAAFLTDPADAKVAVEHYDTIEQVSDGMSNSVSFSISSSVSGSGVGSSSGFVPAGNMSAVRVDHTATLLATGKVLIAGGGTATADLFDPSTLNFSPTGSMNTLRSGATATLLGNGKVLIAGGFGSGTSQLPRLNSTELYDSLSGTFSATGNTSAVLLNDGRVLVAGGTTSRGGGGAATSNAEIYDPATGLFTRSVAWSLTVRNTSPRCCQMDKYWCLKESWLRTWGESGNPAKDPRRPSGV